MHAGDPPDSILMFVNPSPQQEWGFLKLLIYLGNIKVLIYNSPNARFREARDPTPGALRVFCTRG